METDIRGVRIYSCDINPVPTYLAGALTLGAVAFGGALTPPSYGGRADCSGGAGAGPVGEIACSWLSLVLSGATKS